MPALTLCLGPPLTGTDGAALPGEPAWVSARRGWAGQRLALDSPVLTTGPGQHRGGGPGSQALPAGRPHSQRSGSASRGPRSPPAPRCGTPARSGSSLWGRGCLRPSSGVPPNRCPKSWPSWEAEPGCQSGLEPLQASPPDSPSHTGQQVPGRGRAGYGHRLEHSRWRHWMWPSWWGQG